MSSSEQGNDRPWPVVLLTALGAWLAAVPLLIAVGSLLGESLTRGAGAYSIGVLALCGAVVVLRAADVPLFVEQLALPALMVGLGTLGIGVYKDFGSQGGSLILLAVVVGLALLISRDWLRVLLGAAAAGLLGAVLLSEHDFGSTHGRVFWVLHGLLALWMALAWQAETQNLGMAWLKPFSTGWLLMCLVGLTWVTGSTFLVGGAIGSSEAGRVAGWIIGHDQRTWLDYAMQLLSSALVLVGAALGARTWPGLRSVLALAVTGVLAGLAWLMPTLGGAVLALVFSSLLLRWRLGGACAVVVAWVLGAFYYQLHWSLGDKALLLIGAAIVLGGLVWWEHRRSSQSGGHAPSGVERMAQSRGDVRLWLLVLATLVTLLVANGAIWQKQNLITKGQRVFVALAPVDPRSLMQGDYMRLRFSVLEDDKLALLEDLAGKRPHLVMALDPRGVARAVRIYGPGQALGTDEILLELTPKDGAWVIVTDAWFFGEGEGAQWQQAKFGEFRVLPSGKALLVGMADVNLQPIAAGASSLRK